MLKIRRVWLTGIFFMALAMPAIAFADEEEEFESLFSIMDIISFVMVLVSLGIVFGLVRAYGKSIVGVSMVYFLTGTFLLGSIRLLFFLNGWRLISVDEMTLGIIWHMFHWFSLVMFLIAGKILIKFMENQLSGVQTSPSYYNAVIVGAFSAVFVFVTILITSLFFDLFDWYEGTFLDRVGLIHFISFAFGSIVAFYLLKIRKRLIPAIAVIATPLLVTVFLFSASHFWELLTESWRIIRLHGETVEQIEQIIMFPGYIFIVYAFWRSRILLKKALQ